MRYVYCVYLFFEFSDKLINNNNVRSKAALGVDSIDVSLDLMFCSKILFKV